MSDRSPTRRLGYATLTQPQLQILSQATAGRRVLDVGAGNLELSVFLCQYAAHVYALDEVDWRGRNPRLQKKGGSPANLTFLQRSFSEGIPEDVDQLETVIISWAVNLESASRAAASLVEDAFRRGADTLVWIGRNDLSTACGGTALQRLLENTPWGAFHEERANNDFGIYRRCREAEVRTAAKPQILMMPSTDSPREDALRQAFLRNNVHNWRALHGR